MFAVILCWVPHRAWAYIMPVEQLVNFMTANFSNLKTLFITQSVHLGKPPGQDSKTVIEEKIWLKAPGFYHAELAREGKDEIPAAPKRVDISFRRLLLGNDSKAIMALLSRMGIDLESVSYTRIDGVIAYGVGKGALDGSKLLIEKERFLPLFLRYRVGRDPGEAGVVTVRFEDYREFEGGWYPYKITYGFGKETEIRYSIISLEANMPVPYPLTEISGETERFSHKGGRGHGTVEDGHLKEVIRLLKEKYR